MAQAIRGGEYGRAVVCMKIYATRYNSRYGGEDARVLTLSRACRRARRARCNSNGYTGTALTYMLLLSADVSARRCWRAVSRVYAIAPPRLRARATGVQERYAAATTAAVVRPARRSAIVVACSSKARHAARQHVAHASMPQHEARACYEAAANRTKMVSCRFACADDGQHAPRHAIATMFLPYRLLLIEHPSPRVAPPLMPPCRQPAQPPFTRHAALAVMPTRHCCHYSLYARSCRCCFTQAAAAATPCQPTRFKHTMLSSSTNSATRATAVAIRTRKWLLARRPGVALRKGRGYR